MQQLETQMENIPDLLNLEPKPSDEIKKHQIALRYAFTTGDSAGALSELLDNATAGSSQWDPSCYADDLFIDEFISNYICVEWDKFKLTSNEKYLKTVLCHPPVFRATTLFRQEIQRELIDNSSLNGQFHSIFRQLVEFRDDLDSVSSLGRVYFSKWRIDLLDSLAQIIDHMADSFEDAKSGLVRIRSYAREFQKTNGYANLKELVDFEGKLATVNLHLRLGADGRVRELEVSNISENAQNRFHTGPVKRFFARCGLLLRGFRLTEGELVERWVDYVFDNLLTLRRIGTRTKLVQHNKGARF